jgi:hypothetical protein
VRVVHFRLSVWVKKNLMPHNEMVLAVLDHFLIFFVVEEILPELFFGNGVRRFLTVLRQLEHSPDVHVNGSFGHAAKL